MPYSGMSESDWYERGRTPARTGRPRRDRTTNKRQRAARRRNR